MKKKKIIFIVFALAIIMVPIYVIVSSQVILTNGTYYKFKPQAYDPIDPFRGKYLRINYETNNIPTYDNIEDSDEVFVSIGVDKDGFAYFEEAFKKPPKKGDYLSAKVRYVRGAENIEEGVFGRTDNTINEDDRGSYQKIVSIEPPDNMCKYFINEDYAKKAEKAYFKERDNAYIGVRILDGSARMVDIYLDGKPIMDYLKKH